MVDSDIESFEVEEIRDKRNGKRGNQSEKGIFGHFLNKKVEISRKR